MIVAILGGTGYLGAKLTHLFVNNGIKVICIKRSNSDCSRLSDVEEQIEYCLSDGASLEKCFHSNVVDCVINTSCSYIKKDTLDITVIESNYTVPVRVLECAIANGVNKFLSVGSVLPADFNIYTVTKHQFNECGSYYARTKGITFLNIEVSNFYGKDEPGDRFIPYCISKLRKNEKIELTAGTQKRDFIHIDDVAGFISYIVLSENSVLHEKGRYMDVPAGTGEAVSIRQVVEHLKKILNSQSVLDFGAIPLRAEETDCVSDISIMSSMGYKTKYNWKDGLKAITVTD